MTMVMEFQKGGACRLSDGEPLHYTACGLDDVYLVNGFTRDVVDGEGYLTIEDLDGLWKAIGLSLMTRKVLAPKEIKFLRDHMGFTQAQLGGRLRVSDQTIARWEKGETKLIPGSADLMLRVMFLASAAAQPEGGKILDALNEFFENIIGRDEMQPRPVIFRHNMHNKKWKRELQLIAC
jgi:transcriptional regulator with XRE-family HTH domain